ncbi:MAG: BMC domain-containing protein [Candidatus Heimdallarchaeota archaeon]|nr:MAG: BMC domain-containing protein [Candidatus Heimdallarchaeota archaeon]
MTALGFIETYGRVGAVEAADAALKAADVKLISIRRVSGGLVTVVIKGEVAAVQSAVEAAKIRAMRLCRIVNTNVIPGPTDSTLKTISKIKRKK